jgi:hypothetical protein
MATKVFLLDAHFEQGPRAAGDQDVAPLHGRPICVDISKQARR